MLADTLSGKVTNVVAGDTFDILIHKIEARDPSRYNSIERIKIADVISLPLSSIAGQRAKILLETQIWNKNVRVEVRGYDSQRRLVGKYRVE